MKKINFNCDRTFEINKIESLNLLFDFENLLSLEE